MPTLVEQAKQLIQEAKSKEKCLGLAKAVERRMEDLNDASKAGNGQMILGGVFIVVGICAAIFGGPVGVGAGAGLGAAGAAGVANGLATKADAMAKATKELQRAIDDLRECLKK